MYNHTGLQGRLTADPELRYTQQGTAITSFTLASDTGRKTKDGKKITNFIECVAWRAQAEFVCKYLSKGRLVLVEGELTSRSYEDKDGNGGYWDNEEVNEGAENQRDPEQPDSSGRDWGKGFKPADDE